MSPKNNFLLTSFSCGFESTWFPFVCERLLRSRLNIRFVFSILVLILSIFSSATNAAIGYKYVDGVRIITMLDTDVLVYDSNNGPFLTATGYNNPPVLYLNQSDSVFTNSSAWYATPGRTHNNSLSLNISGRSGYRTAGQFSGYSHNLLTPSMQLYEDEYAEVLAGGFSYQSYGGGGYAAWAAFFYVHVYGTKPRNTAPTTYNMNVSMNEDATGAWTPSVTDPDSGSSFTTHITSSPSVGSASITSGRNIRYTPPSNWSGQVSFQFRVRDNHGVYSSIRTITVNVNPLNDPPWANNHSDSTNEDTPKSIYPARGDIDSPTPRYQIISQPANGSVSAPGGNYISFTPNSNWHGSTSFVYRVRDSSNAVSPNRTVWMTVNPVNDAPWADNASYSTNEDTALFMTPPKGDVDGDATSYIVISQPANGSATVSSGQIRYIPPANWTGTTSFSYRVRDPSNAESPVRTLTITVNPINDPPWANDASYSSNEDTSILIDPPKGDIDGNPTTYVIKSQPSNGSVSIQGSQIQFSPNADWNGTTAFTYVARDSVGAESPTRTVTMTVNPVNDQPVVPNLTTTMEEDDIHNVNPPVSDVDAGDTHNYLIISQPAVSQVTATITGGSIRITATGDWNGTTSLQYAVVDSGGWQSSTKTLTINVTPRNDIPYTMNASYNLDEDTLINVSPAITDPDTGDTHTYVIVNQPDNGSLSIVGGSIRFNPHTNWHGTTSGTFLVRDAIGAESQVRTLTFIVAPVNDTPAISNVTRIINEDSTDNFAPVITDPDIGDTHTYNVKSQPSSGTASIVSNQIQFVPYENFTGTTTFNYSVTDSAGSESAERSITYTVQPVSDAPVAQPIFVEVDEGGSIVIPAEFTDPDAGDTHTAIRVSLPSQGTATVISSPIGFSYDLLGSDWNGTLDFRYRIEDNTGQTSNEALITIQVNPVNDAPIVSGASLSINEDESGEVTAIINDPDVGDAHTIEVVQPDVGSVTIDGFSMTYTPPANWNGTTTFSYRALDIAGAYSGYALVSVTVNPRNDNPTTNNLTLVIDEDTSGTLTPAIVDPDAGDSHVLTVQLPPAAGFVSINDLSMDFTPPPNWHGNTFYTYRVTDQGGLSGTASVNITVNPVNDAPIATDISVNSTEDLAFDIPADFSDVDVGDSHTAVIVSSSPHGSIVVAGTIMRFTPDQDWHGTTTFTYRVNDQALAFSNEATVTVTIEEQNDAPSSSNISVSTDEDQAVTITPVIFDPDDGDTYTLNVASSPASGSVTASGNTFTYTPPANWYGNASFTFRAYDGFGASSNTSTVSITVNPVNDVPIAGDISVSIDEDQSIDIPASINDLDPPDSHTVNIIASPPEGSVSISGTTMHFEPTPNWHGVQTFTYTVTDSAGAESNLATVTINGNGVNDAPVIDASTAVTTDEDVPLTFLVTVTDPDVGDTHSLELLSVVDPAEATVSINGLNIEYDPATNWNGVHTVNYRAIDDSGAPSNTSTLTITVTPVNDPPVINNLSININEDTSGSATSTVIDPDAGDSFTLAITTPSAHGVAVITGAQIEFTPNEHWYGNTSLKYRATDSAGAGSNIATVTIAVQPVNDVPLLTDETLFTNEDKPAVFTPTITDYDPTDTHYAVIQSHPDNGTAIVNGHLIEYSPPADWNGVTTLTYTVIDSAGAESNTATLTITVDGVNDAPVIANQYMTVNEDQVESITVPVTDVDLMDTHTVVIDSGPSHGTVSVSGVTITYDSDQDYNGSDQLTFHVIDQVSEASEIVTLFITVVPVNDRPVVTPLTMNMDEDSSGSIQGVVSDVDVGDTHSFGLASQAVNGTVTLSGTTFTYVPDSDWHGTDSFNYRATDNNGSLSIPATVTVTVNPINDAPTTADLSILIDEDEVALFSVVLIDPDIGDTHTINILDNVDNGTIGTVGTQVTYTPSPNWFGTETLTYTIVDSAGSHSNQGTVSITVASVYDSPVVPSESHTMDEDSTISFPVLVADGDLPDDSHALFIVGSPSNGNVSIDGHTLIYSPDDDWNGTDTFSYHALDSTGLYSNTATITIVVNPVNDPPVISPIAVTTDEDTPISIAPLIAEVDEDNTHTLLIINQPEQGNVVVEDGLYVYTPPANWFGSTSFNYRVYDQDDAYSGTETISIEVLSVNDAPVIVPASFNLFEDNEQTITVDVTDADPGETHTLAVLTQPIGGEIVQSGFDLTFTPEPDWNGDTTFNIQATDDKGLVSEVYTVMIHVEPVNDTPTGTDNTLTTDEDTPISMPMVVVDPDAGDSHTLQFDHVPGDGVITSAGTMVTFEPALNWYGDTYLTYRIVDLAGAQSSLYRLDIHVNPVNDPPVAQAMAFEMDEDGTQTLTAPVSDVDIGDMLSIELVGTPQHGTMTVDGHDITYTPDPDWFGTENLSYQARDLDGAVSNLGVITVVVHPVNDIPSINNGTLLMSEDIPSSYTVTVTDVDILTGDSHQIVVESLPENGLATISGLGITFNPDLNWFGTTEMVIHVTDIANAESNSATITIIVDPVNDNPEAQNYSFNIEMEEEINQLVEVIDVDNNTGHTLEIVSMGSGILDIDGLNLYYQAPKNWYGTTNYQYRVHDIADGVSILYNFTVSVNQPSVNAGDPQLLIAEDVETFPIDQQLFNTEDEPIAVVETGVIIIENEPAEGLANYTFTLNPDAELSVVIEGEVVNPGESVELIYNFDATEGRLYLPIYPAVSGVIGQAGFTVDFADAVDWVQLFQFQGYKAWSNQTYAESCFDYLVPIQADMHYLGPVGSGVYRIHPSTAPEPFDVYCDMQTDGGGWTVIQRRAAGTADFNQNWEQYEEGFNSISGDHWLGLQKMNWITENQGQQLLITMAHNNGSQGYEKYASFSVGDQASDYVLMISSGQGSAGDSLSAHSGRAFSTSDRDNDVSEQNCAQVYASGWWFTDCLEANLNGPYDIGPINAVNNRAIIWNDMTSSTTSLEDTLMMIRPDNADLILRQL